MTLCRQSPRVLILLSAAITFILSARPLRADEASCRFLWEQANTRTASARTPEDYLAAAQTYQQLVREGVRNGPLFYNLGTTLLLAGDGENAAAALRRAERYLGSTTDIRINLRQALALQAGQPDTDLPWERTLLFWHYDEPVRIRALAALGGWLLIWLALLLRRLAAPPPADGASAGSAAGALSQPCLLFGLLIALVFSVSTACSLLQEQLDERTWSDRTFTAAKPTPEPHP
jgi:hypothetical protein